MQYNVGNHKNVAQVDDSYTFVTNDLEVQAIKESCGIVGSDHATLFVKVGEAEYIEVWGLFGIVPYFDKTVTLLYDLQTQAVLFEISHTYHAIGELAKTKRFPSYKTFMRRVESWIAINRRANLSEAEIARLALYVAYSARWITADSAFNWYGLDRDSLWIERKR